MFKNIIIITLLFMLGTLLIDNNRNVDLMVENVTAVKNKIMNLVDRPTIETTVDGIKEETFFEEPNKL